RILRYCSSAATPSPAVYSLSLHDALPICLAEQRRQPRRVAHENDVEIGFEGELGRAADDLRRREIPAHGVEGNGRRRHRKAILTLDPPPDHCTSVTDSR